MKYNWSPAEAWAKTGAALLLSTAIYVAFCSFCVTGVPVAQDVGLALGVLGGFPVWVGAMYYAVLARTALRAWLVLGIATGLLAGGTLFAQLLG